jgi:hypothetical protein
MPDPEIDRRCSICGASVRPQALFCPQCGQPIAKQNNPVESATEHVEVVPDLSETQPLRAVPDLAETKPLQAIPDLSETQPLIAVPTLTSEQTPPQNSPNLKRATKVARGLEENVMGRVGKLRKASSIVIDQAAYDPSLRFILVAAALFLLFLFLLVLSKVIG